MYGWMDQWTFRYCIYANLVVPRNAPESVFGTSGTALKWSLGCNLLPGADWIRKIDEMSCGENSP